MPVRTDTIDKPALSRRPSASAPLSFAQQRLWVLHQLDAAAAQAANTIVFAVDITGPLTLGILQGAIGEIARRHEILRTAIVVEDAKPVQVVSRAARPRVTVVDLRALG